jgi:hypothetical protein
MYVHMTGTDGREQTLVAYPPEQPADPPGRYVMICLGLASGKAGAPAGSYLKTADVNAYDGRGWAEWTPVVADAMLWPDAATAWAFWQQTSTVRPTRDDGKPNRPLTAFTVMIQSLDAPEPDLPRMIP